MSKLAAGEISHLDIFQAPHIREQPDLGCHLPLKCPEATSLFVHMVLDTVVLGPQAQDLLPTFSCLCIAHPPLSGLESTLCVPFHCASNPHGLSSALFIHRGGFLRAGPWTHLGALGGQD